MFAQQIIPIDVMLTSGQLARLFSLITVALQRVDDAQVYPSMEEQILCSGSITFSFLTCSADGGWSPVQQYTCLLLLHITNFVFKKSEASIVN